MIYKNRTNQLLKMSFCFAILVNLGCKKEPAVTNVTSVTISEGMDSTAMTNIIVSFGSSTSISGGIDEASSLEVDENGVIWTNNDHGNAPIIYGLDSDGNIVKPITIEGVDNNDWEDLAIDEKDNLYIGDFGNNDNDRKDLAIYMLADFSTLNSTSVFRLSPQIINFSFEDQLDFPPSDELKHFGVEAFVVREGMIYLFTKDRSKPFQGITNMYRLPAESGQHQAELIGTFATASNKKEGAITGADISPDGTKLFLLSEQKIFSFSNFEEVDFFSGTVEEISIPMERKFEGIVFLNNCDLLLVNEKAYGEKPKLLSMDICN